MGFEYNYTCPEIDKEINSAKDKIKDNLILMLEVSCPLLKGYDLDVFVDNWTHGIYADLSECFESVRKTNEDMRIQAEKQIESLESSLEDAEDTIQQLELDTA